jgi:catechol-2,3-dioxygenase
MFKIDHIDHIALNVRDLARATAWYQEVLGLARRYQEVWGDVPTMLCAGMTCLALFPVATTDPNPPPDHNTIAMRHLAFRVNRVNFEQAQAELRRHNIPFSFEDHEIAHSIYFSDLDGHRLEITTYEV